MELALYENLNPKKNTLSIRLAESAVFLNTDLYPRASRDRITEQKSTLLRGLLILHLVKPTKITSIEVELNATTSTAWPEGFGARRIEVNEQHRVFHASTLYFRASKYHARRTASIGPGIYYSKTDIPYYDDDSNDWDDSSLANRSAASPSRDASRTNSNNEVNSPGQRARDPSPQIPSPTPPSRPIFLNRRLNRHVSADYSQFQQMSLHEPLEGIADLHTQQLAPIPPYSFATPIASGSSHSPTVHGGNTDPSSHSPTSTLPNFEDFRRSLYSLRSHQSQSRTTSPAISRRQSVIPEDDIVQSEPDTNPSTNPPTPRLLPTTSSSSPTHTPLASTPSSPTRASGHFDSLPSISRGRKRFSLSAVSNVIIDALSREKSYERDRERSTDTTARGRRGRTMERASAPVNLNEAVDGLEKDSKHLKEKGRGIFAMILGDRDKEKEKEKADAEGWKEFKKGTYTFPISFSIPGNAPPTMICDYGSVTWRLKASVHRPGTFNSQMRAAREVITVACPIDGDTEDSESIIVERHWDQQMQYLISVSGRSFNVGGTVPVTFTLMPLAKVSIYRLSVFLEERVDYYANMKRIARTDPIARFTLLSIKGADNNTPILPLQSDDPDALRHSPLFALVNPGDDLSEVASNLMGPGPWTLHQDLKLPNSCSQMKPTNKNRKSNIIVTHTLKLVMRVARGDDLFIDGKTGKRKLFDIVVQTPVLILSCRCNPEWTSLPQYSKVLDDTTTIVPSCPCRASRPHLHRTFPPIDAITPRHSSDSCASAAETSPVNPTSMASLRQLHHNEAMMRSSSLFERLVSGQESVSGEIPPAYDVGLRPATNGAAML
ncbi:hypothetical protein BYT27DRAFT_7191111 [Phlegmacium glaucopus]|nr:hypothetical protein BYT27DRAFT_7191111 [Phlegmacium glaucopus]